MATIEPENLEKGVNYRIDHRRNLLPSRVGKFDKLLGTQPNVNASFLNVRGPNGFKSPHSAYRTDEWTFRKSGQTIVKEKVAVAIGLPNKPDVNPNEYDHALPNELEKEVAKNLGGRSRRRRTRKHKRTVRKTRRHR